MDICDKLIDIRITINNVCDGFSLTQANKEITLSAKTKILYLLSTKDMTPNELISAIGIAKSNLANLSKSMISEGLIDSYKTLENNRNVYYRITELGESELKSYKNVLAGQLGSIDGLGALEQHIDAILQILKGNKHD